MPPVGSSFSLSSCPSFACWVRFEARLARHESLQASSNLNQTLPKLHLICGEPGGVRNRVGVAGWFVPFVRGFPFRFGAGALVFRRVSCGNFESAPVQKASVGLKD